MKRQWTKQEIWQWQEKTPWQRGCNYVPGNCAGRIAQWQEYEFDSRLIYMEKELALAEETGFNSLRCPLPFEVWLHQREGFLDRLDRFLTIADRHGLSVMFCLGNDCLVAKRYYNPPVFGKQPEPDLGYHGGVKNSPHDQLHESGYSILDEPQGEQAFYDYVEDVVGKFAKDPRVVVWDIFNEPGNGNRGNRSLRSMVNAFEIARSKDPAAPLTTGLWWQMFEEGPLPDIQQKALELSDIVSFHSYRSFAETVKIIANLKKQGRPLMITEWLHRIYHNDVFDLFPLFWLEKIGCYNWGLVAGKSQHYEPWEGVWRRVEQGLIGDADLTKWQHDLYRPNHRPYDPKEIELIQQFCSIS